MSKQKTEGEDFEISEFKLCSVVQIISNLDETNHKTELGHHVPCSWGPGLQLVVMAPEIV
jgi:hypothetical protein